MPVPGGSGRDWPCQPPPAAAEPDTGHLPEPTHPSDVKFTRAAALWSSLILGFLVLIQRGFVIAAVANDGFSKLLAGGLTAAIGLQAILIIGGVTRLIPLTGVTLPFMSYGGSSVVTNFALVALLLIISHRSTAGNTPSARSRREAEAAAERELAA